ncbi:gram-negative porin family protein [Paraburkholderia xenovorans LB400]|uniref:Outer membrane porin, OmpC family n=1 Tax=Paraburkholderia xenovorans (strain LB400) TaxID=266265 RepID=Q141A9_PARXL|nr:porin [Paraburkholderia xenovorans]ABE30080.1 outer membrane porin, OmpC family [Paraburkholderia xenovorans LB400]AIP30252.1 gram-negative porin family protein [Paraburkholderia xenovorans LB400]
MKRYVLTPLAIALAGLTGAAHAQSSVTLYGIIDAGIGYVHNADGNGKQVGMINGNMNGNRWGIKGSEDLGGGLKAVFQLESGFDPGTGRLNQGGREFGRQAFVGLTSDKYGTVTLGRQYDPLVDMAQGITGDNFFGGMFATPGDVDNYDNSLRTSNAVKYVSPTYAGFQVEGLYGFSNGAGTTGQGQTWSGAATYNNGPVSLAAGYFYANNPTANRTTGWNSASSDSLFNSPVNNGYSSAHSIGIARVAGQYVFGSATVGLSYSNARYSPDGKSGFSETEKYNIGNVFAAYQLTPALLVGAGYTYMKASGDTSASYHQASLGADYALSKRTDFYAMAAYQHASGTQSVYDATTGKRTTQAAQASIGSYGYAGTSHQEIAIVGIRHKF